MSYIPKRDRYDIYNNLPPKGQAMIARKCNCYPSLVHDVLHGNRKDYKGIIKEGEKLASVYLWKTRFCRFESEL